MRVIPLYTGKGKTFSPVFSEGMEQTEFVRLIAESGRGITNGVRVMTVADVTDAENWMDCDATEDKASEDIDEYEAYNIIFGGAE